MKAFYWFWLSIHQLRSNKPTGQSLNVNSEIYFIHLQTELLVIYIHIYFSLIWQTVQTLMINNLICFCFDAFQVLEVGPTDGGWFWIISPGGGKVRYCIYICVNATDLCQLRPLRTFPLRTSKHSNTRNQRKECCDIYTVVSVKVGIMLSF